MKKLVGIVAIIAALLVASYYGMGVVTERTLKRNVDVVNQTNGLHAAIKHYDRGWFTSSAKLDWNIHVPAREVTNETTGEVSTVPAQDYAVDMPLKIFHGPVILADSSVRFGLGYARTELLLPNTVDEKFNQMFTQESTKPRLAVSMFVNYLNNTTLRTELPAFTLVGKDKGQFKWMGMTSDLSLSSGLGRVDGRLVIDGMILSKDQNKAVLGAITTSYDLHKTPEGLYLGDASISLPSMVFSEGDKKLFDVQHFEMNSSSHVVNGLFDSSFETAVGSVFLNNKNYGPARLAMAIKNLDATVLAKINQQANNIKQGNDKDRQQAMLLLLPEVPKLFAKGPSFEISELSFVAPEGELKGNASISLPAGSTDNPFQILQKLEGNAHVTIPAVILEDLMRASIKQRLQKQATAPQQPTTLPAATDAPQPNTTGTSAPATAPASASAPETPAESSAVNTAPTDVNSAPTAAAAASAPATPVDVDQQAKLDTDNKLAELVRAGVLVKEGTNYVIAVNLSNGQLTINGQAFNPSMITF